MCPQRLFLSQGITLFSTLQAKSCRPDKDLHEMRYKLVELACRDDMASLTPITFTRESVGFGSQYPC